jgi:hypothetical protein
MVKGYYIPRDLKKPSSVKVEFYEKHRLPMKQLRWYDDHDHDHDDDDHDDDDDDDVDDDIPPAAARQAPFCVMNNVFKLPRHKTTELVRVWWG